MPEGDCPRCDRAADADTCCNLCAEEIMAQALSPQCGGQDKRLLCTVPATASVPPRPIEGRPMEMYGHIRTSRYQETDQPG